MIECNFTASWVIALGAIIFLDQTTFFWIIILYLLMLYSPDVITKSHTQIGRLTDIKQVHYEKL